MEIIYAGFETTSFKEPACFTLTKSTFAKFTCFINTLSLHKYMT